MQDQVEAMSKIPDMKTAYAGNYLTLSSSFNLSTPNSGKISFKTLSIVEAAILNA
jgi:hypothetical protein